MIPHRLDYTIEKVLKSNKTPEQNLLKELTGKKFARDEAEMLLKKIQDHKWNISEMLGRDVGIRVATADYFENIYQQFPCTPAKRNLMTYSSPNAASLA